MKVTRLFDLVDRYKEKYSNKTDAFAYKHNGSWIKESAQTFFENVDKVSVGLLSIGFEPGQKIATLSNNRPEWNYLDLGMMQVGGIHVPIYPTIAEADLKFIFQDAEVKYVFVSNLELWDKVQNAIKDLSGIKAVYTFDKLENKPHWTDILNVPNPESYHQRITEIKATIKNIDLATLLYTSGTTGVPKGVMLSHNNIISQLIAAEFLAPVTPESRALSFLPLNHVYERVLTYLYLYLGVSIYYAESIEKVAENLKEVQPAIFGCVPRLFEKVYDRIVAKGAELTGIKKKLFFWALDLGLKYEPYGANGAWYEFQLKIARKLIFSKWQEALGGNVKAAISGGAALQPRLARVFWAAQIPILEGYGLTETSPVCSVNTLEPAGLKFGTVGKLLKLVEVKIAEDGEILTKGPNLMLGYYKRQDLTDEVIDKDGWFHTGDIGVFEDGVYLKITDRKKEIFKTSGGKYIVPQYIENKLKESRFIEQVMIIGENQKYASAIVVPSFIFLREWCARKNISAPDSNADLIAIKEVYDRIYEEVETVNKSLANYETIKKIIVLPKEWTIDEGELTPKLSLKRRVILDQNKTTIENLYKE